MVIKMKKIEQAVAAGVEKMYGRLLVADNFMEAKLTFDIDVLYSSVWEFLEASFAPNFPPFAAYNKAVDMATVEWSKIG